MSNPRKQDSILEALEAVSMAPNAKIKSLETKLYSRREGAVPEGAVPVLQKAYYIATSGITFRHEGKTDGTPPSLYLADLTGDPYPEKTLVYYSSSGSGKTSELVGSSASRGAHFSFVISIRDLNEEEYEQIENAANDGCDARASYATEEMTSPGSQGDPSSVALFADDFYSRQVNRLAADRAILPTLKILVNHARNEIRQVVQAAIDSDQILKLVLAIDEASSCPRIVRGILRFQDCVKTLVIEALNSGLDLAIDADHLEVFVSIGGTGVSSSTVGSTPNKFSILTPFHEAHWETVVDSKLAEENLTVAVSWDQQPIMINSMETIGEHFPVLSTLMRNGRLASIAVAELREFNGKSEEIREAALVDAIVIKFMQSNGMSLLADNLKLQRLVAASALAVHFFSALDEFKREVPGTSAKIAKWATDMDFFDFSTGCTVRQLVKAYGLLEPSAKLVTQDMENERIEIPLVMTPPQQLVAVWMLGLGVETMLEPTWCGFEFMSTHFVKCALSASLAVCKKKRPSVKRTLERLGCSVDDRATSESVKNSWTELDEYVVSRTLLKEESQNYSYTRQVNVGLKIVKWNDDNTEVLQIDKKLLRALMNSHDCVSEREFAPPLACINEGNSNLCDGIVTFNVQHRDTRNSEKISIMVQAKDYSEGSSLNVTELNKHADTMTNTVLNGAFGERRLLCVASCHSQLKASRTVTMERKYLPFEFNKGILLSPLLTVLRKKRSEAARVEKYAAYCDATGAILTEENRKRKLGD
jgi:hypothetical protein